MKKLALLLTSWPLLATTSITHIEATATQAVITVSTTQSGYCSYVAYQGSTLSGTILNDVNNTLFPGSNSDSRPGSLVSGGAHKFVLGTRGQAGVQISSYDNRAYSRALQMATQQTVGVTCGTDPQVSATFATPNPPAGESYREPRFMRSSPGDYAYPSMDWVDRKHCTVDPETGACVMLAALPGDFLANTGLQAQTFVPTLVGGTGWTGSGQSWSYSGISQGSLFLPITPLSTTSGSASFNLVSTSGPTWAQLVATLSGSSPAVLACLSVNYGQSCAGAQVSQVITTTPTAYTIGTQVPVLESWRNSPRPPLSQSDIVTQTGQVTVSGAIVTWTGGNAFLPTRWGPGSQIVLGTTPCAIASMQSDVKLTLVSSSCVASASGVSYSATNFGFIVKPSTTSNVTVSLSSPSWLLGTSGWTGMPSAGTLNDLCQAVSVTGPTGPGNLCSPGASAGAPLANNYMSNMIFWIGQDGTVNLIGPNAGQSAPPTGGFSDAACGNVNMVFDGLVGGRFYCGRSLPGNTAFGVFYVQYTGGYTATNPSNGSVLVPSSATTVTADINSLVNAYDQANPQPNGTFAQFEANYGGTGVAGVPGWNVVGWQANGTNGALLLQARYDGGLADHVGWWSVLSLDSNSIIALMCTYCGAAGALNRWSGDHSGFGFRQYQTMVDGAPLQTIGISGTYNITTTGTLGPAPWSACPGTYGSSGNNCSTLTLGSLTPADPSGNVLPGTSSGSPQQLILGDYLWIDGECSRIVALSGLVATLYRNQYTQYAGNGQCGQRTSHAANLSATAFPSALNEYFWEWGTDATGQALVHDPDSADCHLGYSLDAYVLGCVNGNFSFVQGKPIRRGPFPQNPFNPVYYVNFDGAFGNSWVPYQDSQDNCMQTHPSKSQELEVGEETLHFVDNRPYMGWGPSNCSYSPTFVAPTLVGTYTYKVSAANIAALNYSYRVHPWMVTSNQKIAVDVSGPSSVLHDTVADNYKFCSALLANECFSGSSPGDVYINFPYVSTVGPYGCYERNPFNDIDIAEMYAGLQGIQEVGFDRGEDNDGVGVRFLTTAFSKRCSQNVFWNSREVALGGWVYTTVDYLDGVNAEPILVKKPPFAQPTSLNQTDYLKLPLAFGGGTSGDAVKIQYGYGEYDQGQLASGLVPPCNPRNEGCYTDSSGANPYVWASETQHATSCSGGCTVTLNVVPAPGGRVVYFRRIRTNGATTHSGPLEIAVVGGGSVAFSNPGVPTTATPTFSPTGGTYMTTQVVTISDSTPSSTIYYTLDGTTPTHASSVYSSSLTISSTTTVKALGSTAGYTDSAVATATYSIVTGITYVNSCSGQFNTGGAGTTSVPCSSSISVSAGNLLVCNAFWSNTATPTLTDAVSGGDTFTSVASETMGLGTVQQWYAKNTVANASALPTLSLSGSGAGYAWLSCGQRAGASTTAPLDTYAVGYGSGACGAGAMTTGTFTTTSAVEDLVAGFALQLASSTPDAGTGYTLRDHSADNILWTEDQNVTAIQTGAAATFGTASCNSYSAVVGTYH
jgi:hypothetical protein